MSGANRGRAVHAAAYLRRRRIVLETELLEHSGELRRILLHELFHFAWVRLGNPARRVWEGLLHAELAARARGELGWSAEHRKSTLTANDRRLRTRRWREYVCESFCDSGACFLSGQARHEEFTLASRFRSRRSLWFQNLPAGGRIPI